VQSAIDHRAIFEAITAGSGSAASAAMLQHLKNVESSVLDALRRYQGAIAGLPRTPGEAVRDSHAADGGAIL
jgi:hypothetical protein